MPSVKLPPFGVLLQSGSLAAAAAAGICIDPSFTREWPGYDLSPISGARRPGGLGWWLSYLVWK